MIIGNGLLGKNLLRIDRKDVIFFASGVSDSKSNIVAEFDREESLILQQLDNKEKLFIYFSSCSIYDGSLQEMPYVIHKMKMETIISSYFPRYLIVRTTNIVGKGGNPTTIMNYLHNAIMQGNNINIWKNAERNILDVDDLVSMLDIYLQKYFVSNETIVIANNKNYSIVQILHAFEKYMRASALYTEIDLGTKVKFDMSTSQQLFTDLSISHEDYLDKVIRKYY